MLPYVRARAPLVALPAAVARLIRTAASDTN